MDHSNLAILTQSHKAIAAKRRKKNSQIKELVFDEDARREFLTGFHKRKVAKKEEAKKRAILREKQQRLELRRERRRALAERAAQNAAEVEKACGAILDDDEGENVADDASEIGEEYEGEEQLATVTVVEDFDPAALLHEKQEQQPKSRSSVRSLTSRSPSTVEGTQKSQQQGNSTAKNKSKKRSKVKYQTKAERAAERAKQRARRTEKAERAGGKASRKKKRH
ncbi:nucleolar protein 12-domain-containing protein [Pisolithus croceorrhizus]|nr:nucleolar protein 12-domain-containing protein [Pisolithus sp. B1]KAI6123834.1 nucleolar protein 12-domain-containing protein [Pisolithus croceorrhizus]